MPTTSRRAQLLYAWLAYLGVAIAFTWPLAIHLGSTLTAPPEGDGGVYVWNQWVFRYELLENGRLPYLTQTVFGSGSPADLSLHNYTVFLDLLALPLIGTLGVVATFNIVYLFTTTLTAVALYLLARDLDADPVPAWLAGLAFAWGPVLVTRGMGHFSLVAAAPLPILLLLVRRACERQRAREAIGIGLTIAWAVGTDPYYAVYCLLLGGCYLALTNCELHRFDGGGRRQLTRTLTVLCLLAGAVVLTIALAGGRTFQVFGQRIGMHSLYTPVLILTVVIIARAFAAYRVRVVAPSRSGALALVRLTTIAGSVAAIALAPFLLVIGRRLIEGRFASPRIFWRSSPSGVDLLSLLLPNPNHPLAPKAFAQWLSSRPDGYLEAVGSISLVALAVCVAAWYAKWRPQRWLVGMTVFFGLLSLGPFIAIAGTSTYVPTPWALLRYVPIVTLARTPARFAVVLALLLALLFASALTALRRTSQRRAVVAIVGIALAFELLPAPRRLYSAEIPPLYRHVQQAPSDAKVLELPFGIRDGTMSVGNFTARTQFYQTAHARTVMGGYLSRVSAQRVKELEANPVLYALAILSERQSVSEPLRDVLMADGVRFLRDEGIAFVIIDQTHTPQALRSLAVDAFQLRLVESDGALSLYRPPVTTAASR
jgi:hypothetical protein